MVEGLTHIKARQECAVYFTLQLHKVHRLAGFGAGWSSGSSSGS